MNLFLLRANVSRPYQLPQHLQLLDNEQVFHPPDKCLHHLSPIKSGSHPDGHASYSDTPVQRLHFPQKPIDQGTGLELQIGLTYKKFTIRIFYP